MQTLHKYRFFLLIIPIIIVAIWLCPKGCSVVKQNLTTQKPDTITPKIKKNKADILVLVDSSKIFKEQLLKANKKVGYYKVLYKSTYDSLYSLSDSVGKIRLSITNEIKQKQDSAHEAENQYNLLLVVNAYNQIGEYQDNELLYTQKIKSDSIEKKELTTKIDSLVTVAVPKAYKQGKKKGFWNGIKVGVPVGGALTKGVEVGVNAIGR